MAGAIDGPHSSDRASDRAAPADARASVHHDVQLGAAETAAPMVASEIRRKAALGAIWLGSRGVGVRVFGLAGNVVLARLLVPSEFGTVAVGLALLTFGLLVFDGGLGASLIRRAENPTVDDLRNVLAVQMAGAMGLAALVAGIGIAVGERVGSIAAVMMLALPIAAIRGPGTISLERRLAFRPIAAVEVGEVLAYYLWAAVTVAAGLGVWGLATASVVKALVGTVILLGVSPVGLLKPAVSLERIRSLLHFGLRVQAVQIVGAVRDQGVNLGTFTIAGAATLGIWMLAARLLQIPLLLLESLWRVSFPAMSQLLGAGEDPRPLLERGVRLTATVMGLILTVLVSSTPALVPALFGPGWGEATGAIAAACLGLQINGPVSAAVAGYLFASGQAGIMVRSATLQTVAWFAVTFPLLPHLGVIAVGVGYVAVALVEAVILSRAAAQQAGARLVRGLVPPLLVAIVASAIGWELTDSLGPTIFAAAAGGLVGGFLYVLALFALGRSFINDLVMLGSTAWRRRHDRAQVDAVDASASSRS